MINQENHMKILLKKNSMPKNLNLKKGMKFIRNNSNSKNKNEKFVLPNIINKSKKNKNKANNSKNLS